MRRRHHHEVTVVPITSVELQPSETHVLAAASRIYAAFIASGQVSMQSAEEMIETSVRQAIHMAYRVDRLVQSDDEHSGAGTWSPAV